MDDFSSIDESGGSSFGVTGVMDWDSDKEIVIEQMMLSIVDRIEAVADGFFGHVKAIIESSNEWVSLNLVDARIGVEKKGSMGAGKGSFKIMAVALDIDRYGLKSIVMECLSEVEGVSVSNLKPGLVIPR